MNLNRRMPRSHDDLIGFDGGEVRRGVLGEDADGDEGGCLVPVEPATASFVLALLLLEGRLEASW